MRVAIIDADLIGRDKHRFPNLACEKISAYWKEKGAKVTLKLDYDGLDEFDAVYISKVFTDTYVPEHIKATDRIHIGGTGFFFDKAPALPPEIEHHMPDYHLYDEWIELKVALEREKRGDKFNEKSYRKQFRAYTDYSIGFLTRGCFRKCGFCVNKKYDRVFKHSNLSEFYDASRPKLCFLDDNFLGHPGWRDTLEEVRALNKRVVFKQGLDERLLTDEKCEAIFSLKYDGDFTFAFDSVKDYDLIESKLKLINKHNPNKSVKFYVLVGFEGTDAQDIENAFKRIALLMKHKCLAYVMRYRGEDGAPYENSKYRGLYITLARWTNQPNLYKKKSFREFCEANQAMVKTPGHICSSLKALQEFEREHPEIAAKYFDMKYGKED